MIDFRKVPYSDDYTKQETDANTVGELFVLEALLMAVLNKFATTKTGETKKTSFAHTIASPKQTEKNNCCVDGP